MDHSFCRPPTSVFLLLESLFQFRPFLLSCSSGTSDIPVHTKWKIDQCTCSKSEISGRHLIYFPMKCLQINWISLCPFSFQERRKDFLRSWRTSIQRILPTKHSSVDTPHSCFYATDISEPWNSPGWIIPGLPVQGTPRDRKRKKECGPFMAWYDPVLGKVC